MRKIIFCSSLLFAFITGCGGYGGSILPNDRTTYNEAIQKSNMEEMLLNLVRMRYDDPPLFVKVSSLTSSLSRSINMSVFSNFATYLSKPWNLFEFEPSTSFTENPVISYAPLQGMEFINRMMSKITLDKIFLMIESGWDFEMVSRVCFAKIGKVENALNASGPSPTYIPEYEEFIDLSQLIRLLQLKNAVHFSFDETNLIMDIDLKKSDGFEQELNTLLGTPNLNSRFYLSTSVPSNLREGVLNIKVRSILGILYYLSLSVRVPPEDITMGFVNKVRDEEGSIFDFLKINSDILKIYSEKDKPSVVSVQTSLKGHNWYLDAADVQSKKTFSFLLQLFALQAAKVKNLAPPITIPIGRN
jgi:hypothetical protein